MARHVIQLKQQKYMSGGDYALDFMIREIGVVVEDRFDFAFARRVGWNGGVKIIQEFFFFLLPEFG